MDKSQEADETKALTPEMPAQQETECPYCGADLGAGEKYCAECGYEVGSLAVEAEAGAAEPTAAAVVEITVDGETFGLAEGEHVLGRSEGDVIVSNPYLSRRHMKLTVRERKLFAADLGSTNGTFVDGERLEPDAEREVGADAELKAGELAIELRWLEAPETTEEKEPAEAESSEEKTEAPAEEAEPASTEVAEVDSPWALKVGDEQHRLNFGEVRIGRKTDRNDLAFPNDGYMSGAHAVLDVDLDYLKLKDLGSTNGTLVNGEKIAPNEWVELKAGDEIQAGQTAFIVEVIARMEPVEPPAEEAESALEKEATPGEPEESAEDSEAPDESYPESETGND